MIDYRNNNRWSVYIHTVPKSISGYDHDKYYVGLTSIKTKDRWANGKGYKEQVFDRAIQKYGWDNIDHEIVAENLTKDEANNFEITLIKLLNATNPKYGYNVQPGGNSREGMIAHNNIDITGKQYGHLTVLKLVDNYNGKMGLGKYWLCQCDCNNKTFTTVRQDHLTTGKTVSCGCVFKEKISEFSANPVTYYDTYVSMYIPNCDINIFLDYDVYEDIKYLHWNYSNKNHNYTCSRKLNGEKKIFYLYDYIFGGKLKRQSISKIRFRNNNCFDLRRSNLYIDCNNIKVTHDDYIRSLYKMCDYIALDSHKKRWVVSVGSNGIKHTARFDTLVDAIEYRNKFKYIETSNIDVSFLLY